MKLETFYEEQLNNETLPELVFAKFKPLTTSSTSDVELFSFFTPANDVIYDIILAPKLFQRDKSLEKRWYFDIPAEQNTNYASNAYWYLVANQISNPFTETYIYDTFAEIDVFRLQIAIKQLGYTFETDLDELNFYVSPYLDYLQIAFQKATYSYANADLVAYALNQYGTKTTDEARLDLERLLFTM